MANFPLLKLPLLASLDVLKEMNFFDLLNFSQLSKRSLRLCKEVQPTVNGLTWVIHEGYTVIHLDIREQSYLFAIKIAENADLDEELGDEKIVFEGHEFYRSDDLWIYDVVNPLTATADGEKVFYTITNRILELVRCSEFVVEFEVPFTPELPLWNIRRQFTNLVLNCSTPLTVETMQFMLENITIDNFHVLDGIPADFMLNELPFKSFVTVFSEWIDSSAFLEMECETVEITSSTIPFDVINLIVKKWISGDLPNLEFIKMQAIHADRTRILLECTEGVEIAPYHFRVRPKIKTFNGIGYNLYRGVDFKRTDGKIATIDILPDDLFLFVAW